MTSIELLPIQAKQSRLFLQERNRTNYWGYSTLGYFAPEASYATKQAREAEAGACSRRSSTWCGPCMRPVSRSSWTWCTTTPCRSGPGSPTICWRGLDNLAYTDGPKTRSAACTTRRDAAIRRLHQHARHHFAVDSLRYWAKRIGIDGFRFDLAATLARLDGEFTRYHPFLYALRSDLLLGNLKDDHRNRGIAADGWRTGQFGIPFAEWSGRCGTPSG